MSSSKYARIKAILTDVDGVLTDGRIYYGSSPGDHATAFDVRDGIGQRLCEAAGIPVVWLTGRVSKTVVFRARKMGVAKLLMGRMDKVKAAAAWCRSRKLSLSQIAYLGDDLIDLALLKAAGWSVAPADARPEARAAADTVTRAPGGKGAFREAVETLLKRQGKWGAVRRAYERSVREMD
jgi:3-deoxy-D-manno-octulosonate 8-phosphate phosphatase (KDO 8-P phosphatase)